MAPASAESRSGTNRRWLPGASSDVWLFAVIAIALLVHLHMALTRAVNWDEFYHYSQVQKLAQGTLNEPLQTLYTRAFAWVVDLPGSGIDHIIVIRLFMFLCEIIVTVSMIGAASRFFSRSVAALCALAYLTTGYVLQHGTSFRFDAPAAALLTASGCLLLRSGLRWRPVLAAGILAGIAAVLTIKTVLYAPVFLGIAWLLWREAEGKRAALVRLLATAAIALFSAILIYALHASDLAVGSGHEATTLLSSAGGNMIALMSYWTSTLRGAELSIAQTLVVLLCPVALWTSRRPTPEKIALAGFYLPILTLFFYHNTAPYFFVYMLPPVLIAGGTVMQWIADRRLSAAFALLLLLSGGSVLLREPPNTMARQREILRVADRMFPNGVAYFDSCAMLGRFPKANPFMTLWGIARYQAGDFPSMVATMAAKPVPLVVNNDYMFKNALTGSGAVPEFLPSDLAALRETYIPLWGPFWIAGEKLPPNTADHEFDIRVPGPYTVRDGVVTVDGRRLDVGATIHLERGRHRASTTADSGSRLTWGDRLNVPAEPDRGGRLYMPF